MGRGFGRRARVCDYVWRMSATGLIRGFWAVDFIYMFGALNAWSICTPQIQTSKVLGRVLQIHQA